MKINTKTVHGNQTITQNKNNTVAEEAKEKVKNPLITLLLAAYAWWKTL